MNDTLTSLPRLTLPEFHHLVDGLAIPAEYQVMTAADTLTVEICDQTAVLLKVQAEIIVGLRITHDGRTAVSWGTLANAQTVFTQTSALPKTAADVYRLAQRYHDGLAATAALQAESRERLGNVLRQMGERERDFVAFLRGEEVV